MSMRLSPPDLIQDAGTRAAGDQVAVVASLAATAMTLAACSSSPSSTATTSGNTKQTTATTAAGASLSSLEAKAPSSSVSLQETARAFSTRCSTCGCPAPSRSSRTSRSPPRRPDRAPVSLRRQQGRCRSVPPTRTCRTPRWTQYPGLMNIPLAISSQFIAYNVPQVTGHLKLTGKLLSAIYQGQVTKLERLADQGAQPGVNASEHPDRHRAPIRQLG